MSDSSFYQRMLASLQQTVHTDLLPALASSRHKEFANATARLLARYRANLESAPLLAAQRIKIWRQLAGEETTSGTIADPLEAFTAETARVSETIKNRRADPAFLHDLRQPSSASSAWLKQIVAATLDYIDAYEAAVPKTSKKNDSPLADPEQLRLKLSAYLSAHYPQLPPDPVLSLKIIPGGNSKETSLFELRPNNVMPSRLVLRRQLGNDMTGTSVFGEYSLLKEMEKLDLPIPRPIAAEKDASHLGGAFILVEEVADSECVGAFFPELNDMARIDASFAPDLTRALARLHSITRYPEGEGLGGHHAAPDPMDMVRNFQTLWDGIAHKPPMSVATELGFAYLLSHPLPDNRPRRLVHGDVGLHNLMMRDGRLTAILDWELAHIGDPAEDIGYIRATILSSLMPWDAFVATYTAAGGDKEALDIEAVNWYGVWAYTRNSVYLAMVYDLACKEQRNDIDAFYVSIDFAARMQQYIVRELKVALDHEERTHVVKERY